MTKTTNEGKYLTAIFPENWELRHECDQNWEHYLNQKQEAEASWEWYYIVLFCSDVKARAKVSVCEKRKIPNIHKIIQLFIKMLCQYNILMFIVGKQYKFNKLYLH